MSITTPQSTLALGPVWDHAGARHRAADLLRWSQTGMDALPEAMAELIEYGRASGWPDVVALGMYVKIVYGRRIAHMDSQDDLRDLMQLALDLDDPATLALAYAVRSLDRTLNQGGEAFDAHRDLARATALLEKVSGPSSEAVAAHIEAGRVCGENELWELQLRHYEAAEARLDPAEDPEIRRATLRYNIAEVQLNWLVALRELREEDAMATRAAAARRALRDADVPEMPISWREELLIFEQLVNSISPEPGLTLPSSRAAVGDLRGYVHLSHALRERDARLARAHCDRAMVALDLSSARRMRLFALTLAAEMEAEIAGSQTAGLRLARVLIAQRGEYRSAMLTSLESLIAAERSAAEQAQLREYVYRDDLTGLANRRALNRFVERITDQSLTKVSVALIDLDHFKGINDTHGHAVGDAVLVRVAELMRGCVRADDLLVRLGGDEFLLVLTSAGQMGADRCCEAIRRAVDTEPWDRLSPGLAPSVSIGIARGPVSELESLKDGADASLYRAKQSGRNCVIR